MIAFRLSLQGMGTAIAAALLANTASAGAEGSTITFPSEDGLLVTADVYAPAGLENRPVIVLFHQAGFSRGEYRDTAPLFNDLGFACIAVDQRSGNKVNGIVNETAKRARAEGLGTRFEDALPDMRAALAHARAANGGGAVIGLGSSYSSSLVLTIAADRPDLIDATLSFSPGEYFADRKLIQTAAAKVDAPVFITSARSEQNAWSAIFNAIQSMDKVGFTPVSAGRHGSSTLWPTTANNDETWTAVEMFLTRWITASTSEADVVFNPATGEIMASFTSAPGDGLVVEGSRDLNSWIAVAGMESPMTVTIPVSRGGKFFRSRKAEVSGVADVIAVKTRGSAGNHTFDVTVSSPDTGCEQYTDWWEVLNADGDLLYRRVLRHSHVSENPFTRSGGTVPIDPDTVVWIRAHMNHSGYGGKAMTGSVAAGFQQADLPATFAPWGAMEPPLPDGCDF